jgi:arginase family enzyme
MDGRSPHKFLKSGTVGVIGCPFSGGQPKAGVDTGPHHLIDFGLLDQIKELGYNVSFGGHQQFAQVMTKEEDPDIGKLKRPKYVGSVTHAVKDAVAQKCKAGELALTLGGDHSLAIGTVSGVFEAYPDACLIWIDAVSPFVTRLMKACGYQYSGIYRIGEYSWYAGIVSYGYRWPTSGATCMGRLIVTCLL